jgi:hypothetical protein
MFNIFVTHNQCFVKKNITLCIFLATNFISFCQNKDTIIIIPGENILMSHKIKSYKLQYDFISSKDGVEKIIGGLEDEFYVRAESHNKTGLRICNITFGTNTILDSGSCFLKGLKPIYHRSIQTKKRINLDFNGEFVNGKILFHNQQGDSTEIINYISATALFDSYYEDLIAKTIRFKKGFLFKFPEYIYERGGLVWSTGQVVGKVEISNKNGSKDAAWKILFFENDPNGKIVRTTTYIIKEYNREIITREYKTKTNLILMRQKEG